MENRASYFWVGIFVFGIFFLSLFFIIWLGDFGDKQKFKLYQIYTKESVSGLGIKAPVKLLGVEVGSVESIDIHTNKSGLGVAILVKIKENIPITTATLASLQLQGITGLKYIDLSESEENAPKLQSLGDEPPVIKVKESFFSVIDRQGDKLFHLLDFTNEKARVLLSDENIEHLNEVIANVAGISKTLNTELSPFLQSATLTSKKLSNMADSVDITAQDFSKFSKEAKEFLREYADMKSPLIANLELLRVLLIELNGLSADLRKNPADLFFKRTKTKNAPGE